MPNEHGPQKSTSNGGPNSIPQIGLFTLLRIFSSITSRVTGCQELQSEATQLWQSGLTRLLGDLFLALLVKNLSIFLLVSPGTTYGFSQIVW